MGKLFPLGSISTESFSSDMITMLGVKHSGEAVVSQQLLQLPILNLFRFINLIKP